MSTIDTLSRHLGEHLLVGLMDIREILPYESYQISIKLSVKDLNKGTYTLGIAIIDPQTKQPAVQLAMENYRQDFIYMLGSFKVIRLVYQ